jgi:hypothetical protein
METMSTVGFNSVGETLTLITTNTSEGSTFCGNGQLCINVNWGTFAIPNPNKSYRYLRLQVKEQSCSTSFIVVLLDGFEVFGVYSKDTRYILNPTSSHLFMSSMLLLYSFFIIFFLSSCYFHYDVVISLLSLFIYFFFGIASNYVVYI